MSTEDSSRGEAKPNAEIVFGEFLRRRGEGEALSFEELCRKHPRLAHALRVLHSIHSQNTDDRLDSGDTASLPPKVVRGKSTPAQPPEKRARIGPYRILQVLGEGGMGVVYLAEQTAPIRRRVAVKLIKVGMDTKEVIARFESERQALALMNHPGIATVFDAGSTREGRPYFVMEHVPGEPITRCCDRRRLSTRERLGLFVQMCDAVQHAHQKGIIHRDIKPSNVLVMVQDGALVSKIIDFGVARATNQRLTERTVFTDMGQILGTPEYMSPEQAEMTAEDIDTRTDIYSLGVLLYELLVGALPFESRALRRAGYAEIQRIIREEEPPKPSTRLSGMGQKSASVAGRRRTDFRTLRKQVRGDLDWITMKAMEKDRNRRYTSASELAADIVRHRSHEPVQAGPPSAAYQLKKLARKHRGFVAAAGSVFLALALGIFVSLRMYFEAEDARRRLQDESDQKTEALLAKQKALLRSEGLRLVALSSAVLESDQELALLLAIEAAKRHPGLHSNNALLAGLTAFPERRTLWRHNREIDFTEFSPDGKRLLTLSSGIARILNVETGTELFRLKGVHGGRVAFAAFSRGGTRVLTYDSNFVRLSDASTGRELFFVTDVDAAFTAAVNSDGTRIVIADFSEARVVDAITGKVVAALEGFAPTPGASSPEGASSVVFSPDGARVLAALTGATVTRRGRVLREWKDERIARIWDAETGKIVVTLEGHEDSVGYGIFSPDGKRVLTYSRDKTVRVWNADTGKELLKIPEQENWPSAFSPDGAKILSVTADRKNTPGIWDTATGRKLLTLPTTALMSASFSPDGKQVVTTGEWVSTWDTGTGKQLARWKHGLLHRARFTPDGKRVLTTSYERIDRETGIAKAHIWTLPPVVGGNAVSQDGRRVAGPSDGGIQIWDLATGDGIFRLEAPSSTRFFLSPDGTRICIPGQDGPARVWVTRSDAEPVTLEQSTNRGQFAVFHPLGDQVALFGDSRKSTRPASGKTRLETRRDTTVDVWSTETGDRLWSVSHDTKVSQVAFSSDGRRLFTMSFLRKENRKVTGTLFSYTGHIWNAETGEEIVRLKSPLGTMLLHFLDNARVFSPDATKLVTVSRQSARVWDAATGDEIVAVVGHDGEVHRAEFSGQGDRVATASVDNTARIWDVLTGDNIHTFSHSDMVLTATFGPDGRLLATGSAASGGKVRVWDTRTGSEVITLAGEQNLRGFSEDGRWVITSGGKPAAVRRWPVDPLSAAMERDLRDLTPVEVERYEIGPLDR